MHVKGEKMPVVVAGRKATCWKCRESGDLSSFCPEKRDTGVLTSAESNPPLFESVISASVVMGMPTIETGVLKPSVGSNTQLPFPVKPFLAACGKGQWLVVDKSRGKLRRAGSQSPEAPMGKDTNSPTSSTSSKGDDSASYTEAMKIKYERNFEKKKRRKYNTLRQI